MIDYDFLILSPNEFEDLSRDLLQRKFGRFIESFTTGKDGGIDFRYTTDNTKTSIIQAKRYKDYKTLFNHLKKEVTKITKLSPDRYILTTSVGLTPQNKSDIQSLFSPYIKLTEDILGRDDLNNLLGQYKEIESKFYKLWLTSVNILNKILHSKIYNQSSFELDEIKEQVKLYVQNDSFNEALSILKNHHYIIISGIPGIGKTTLARILILFLLSSEFEEFIYLTDSIDDGYEFFNDSKKQVFFFDDFLGRVRFDARNQINADTKIVKFIEKVKKAPDKILILATREYILSQARNAFEVFNISNVEIAKCILDLSSYTKIIKSQIIYNHLFFANVPQSHLLDLVENKNYLQLVNHKNYNPRIIETIINRKIWEQCAAEQFALAFKSYFDNPQSVWLYAFENSLDKFSHYTLLVLLTLGTPVLIQDLELSVKEFLIKNNYKYIIGFDSITFNRAIRELENTFIRTQKDSYDGIVVEYQNPSIQDFLVYYLRDKDDLISNLIGSALYVDQFFNVFTTDEKANITVSRFIRLSDLQVKLSINRIKEVYNNIQTSRVNRVTQFQNGHFCWDRYSGFIFSFLRKVNVGLATQNADAKIFVYEKFQELIVINELSYSEQSSYIQLLSTLDLSRLTFDPEQLVGKFFENITSIDSLELFSKLEDIFPTIFEHVVNDVAFIEKVTDVIQSEIRNVSNSEIHGLIDQIESVENIFSLSYAEVIEDLRKKDADYDSYLESQIDDYINDERDSSEVKGLNVIEETEIITQIFNSLISE